MDLTDEAKAEIAAAIKILRDDGVHVHKTYARYMKENGTPPTDPKTDPKTEPVADPKKTEGQPPPAKEPSDPPTDPPKKAGLWWGTRE